jgi:hypothetical protein
MRRVPQPACAKDRMLPHPTRSYPRLPHPAVSALAALLLAACGGGGGGGGESGVGSGSGNSGGSAGANASAQAAAAPVARAAAVPDAGPASAQATTVGSVSPPVSPAASLQTPVFESEPQPPAAAPAPPAPAPAAPVLPVVQVTTSQATVTPNTRYEVNAAAGTTVDLRLLPPYDFMNPVFFAAGDIVSARGTGSGNFRLVPGYTHTYTARGRTMPNFITTIGLPGNAAPGERWTPRLDPSRWQAVASEPEGSVLVAADAGGALHVSLDAGNSWSAAGSPTGDWADLDATRMTWMNPSSAAGAVYMAAALRGGAMYRYGSSGWTAVVGPAGTDFGKQAWEAVAVTPGNTAIGAVLDGPILSETAGALAAQGSTTPLVRRWRDLAITPTGLVAVNEEGEVWAGDTTAGLRQLSVNVGGAPVRQPWTHVAVSGSTIAMTGRTDRRVYLSRDDGLNWVRTAAPAADHTALAVAAGGQVIATTSAAGIQLSRDGGASFAALPAPTLGGAWRAVALSEDGNLITAANSQLYTSLGNRTSYTSGGGAITGGPGDFVELESVGRDQFRVRAASGGPFTIR